MNKDQKTVVVKSSGAFAVVICMMVVLSIPFGMIPPLGNFLLPGTGIWDVPDNISSYEEISDSNLIDEVKIYRDELGIPHIYGHNEEDLMFALGYCHAQDRMIQMDLIRRSSRGTLSELVGPSMFNQLGVLIFNQVGMGWTLILVVLLVGAATGALGGFIGAGVHILVWNSKESKDVLIPNEPLEK